MKDAAHSIGQELMGIAIFVGVVWGAFILNWIVFLVDFNSFGLVPRTLWGTVGIVSMPFLHAGWGHLLGNTVPLFILLALLAGSKARSWEIVAEIVVAGGVLLWIFGRNATHVGASGLIFGLVAFLIISGLLERRIIPLIVSFAVGILYGGTLIWGVLPGTNFQVSWDGHLCGAIAGGLIAWLLTREPKQKSEELAAA
jgi:membrane associated rhomboid family serine protease